MGGVLANPFSRAKTAVAAISTLTITTDAFKLIFTGIRRKFTCSARRIHMYPGEGAHTQTLRFHCCTFLDTNSHSICCLYVNCTILLLGTRSRIYLLCPLASTHTHTDKLSPQPLGRDWLCSTANNTTVVGLREERERGAGAGAGTGGTGEWEEEGW